jgi:hypothetical protein
VIDISGGGILSLDPTSDADRTRAVYVIAPTVSITTNSRYRFNGSAGSRATVRTLRTNGDEARGRFTILSYVSNLGYTEATFADLVDLGSASTDAITGYIGTSGGIFTFEDCTFTRCGRVNASPTSISLGAIVRFRRNVWAESLGNSLLINDNVLAGGAVHDHP